MFVEQGKNKNQYLGNNEILRVMFDEKKVIKMNEIKVTFKNPEEILDFVKKVTKYDCPMDMKRGRFVVDAKSILGIMNLGLNNVINLKVYDDDCEQLKQEISQYVAA